MTEVKREDGRAREGSAQARGAAGEGSAAREGSAALGGLAPGASLGRAHRRLGFVVLALALLAGTALEALLGLKAAAYLLDPLRRELWSLAHVHAAGLALLNLVYVPYADRGALSAAARRRASQALRLGTVLLPLGFFLGGIAHPEGDPSLGVALVPLGALLVIGAAATQVVAAYREG